MNLNGTELNIKTIILREKVDDNDCIRSIYYWNKRFRSMWFLKYAYAVGYINSIILLNLGSSSNFHMNNFTVLRLIEDDVC